jgi:hypothetical protein
VDWRALYSDSASHEEKGAAYEGTHGLMQGTSTHGAMGSGMLAASRDEFDSVDISRRSCSSPKDPREDGTYAATATYYGSRTGGSTHVPSNVFGGSMLNLADTDVDVDERGNFQLNTMNGAVGNSGVYMDKSDQSNAKAPRELVDMYRQVSAALNQERVASAQRGVRWSSGDSHLRAAGALWRRGVRAAEALRMHDHAVRRLEQVLSITDVTLLQPPLLPSAAILVQVSAPLHACARISLLP